MSGDAERREQLCALGASLFNRGLTHGSTGNISVRRPEGGWLMTPTGASLGALDPGRLSELDGNGQHVTGDAPTKEARLHLSMYGRRTDAEAVVHLHSTHAVAVSCLDRREPAPVLPPMTAYYAMRIGDLGFAPYFAPGDPLLAKAVDKLAGKHHAILLANHGPLVAGSSLTAAADAIEELEETARLFLMLRHESIRVLSAEQVDELRSRFSDLKPVHYVD